MNILFLINEFERNGAERVVSYLLNYLPKTIPGSILYLFLLEQSEIGYPIPESVEVIIGSKLHPKGLYKFLKLIPLSFRVKKVVKEKNVNTVVSFLSRSNYVNILSTMVGSPHRAIISERHTPSVKYKNKEIKDRINRRLIHYLYQKCNEIIAVSKGVKKDLETNFNIPGKNISVIYNPFHMDKIKNDAKKNVDHKWLSDSNIKTIITLGRLEEPKNHVLLINAFQLVEKNMQDVRLIIIGEGSKRSALAHLIKKLNLQSKVDLTGKKENPFPYLAIADLFVLSSNTEGFPNVIIESMICGCPVISTDCPSGPNEIIKTGENGILVPVDDVAEMNNAITSLLKNNDLRLKIKQNALKSVYHLGSQQIIGQYAGKLQYKV